MPPKTKLPGGYCEDCFKGTLHGDDIPAGTEEVIHGLNTYVARPPEGTTPIGTLILTPDVFGWGLRNTRALADAYARRTPCIVYLPDFMNSEVIEPCEAPLANTWSPIKTGRRVWTSLRSPIRSSRRPLHTPFSLVGARSRFGS
jgi:hypothetical protein